MHKSFGIVPTMNTAFENEKSATFIHLFVCLFTYLCTFCLPELRYEFVLGCMHNIRHNIRHNII